MPLDFPSPSLLQLDSCRQNLRRENVLLAKKVQWFPKWQFTERRDIYIFLVVLLFLRSPRGGRSRKDSFRLWDYANRSVAEILHGERGRCLLLPSCPSSCRIPSWCSNAAHNDDSSSRDVACAIKLIESETRDFDRSRDFDNRRPLFFTSLSMTMRQNTTMTGGISPVRIHAQTSSRSGNSPTLFTNAICCCC